MRGDGRLFKRGRFWWLAYFHNGQEIRESVKTDDEEVARKKLRARLKTAGSPTFIGPKEERVRFEDLAALYLADYRKNRRRSIDDAERLVRHLRTFFDRDRALAITAERIDAYIDARLADHNKKGEPIARATVNRELSALRRMFNRAHAKRMLSAVPHIALLAEDNAREGFFEAPDFEALAAQLPPEVADVARFAFLAGWRRGEILSLEWRDVDLAAGTIRLRRARSKSKKGRLLVLSGELLDLIRRRAALRRMECPYVFHRNGRPLRCFRESWQKACKAAGFEGRLFHDLRRSAVRNMVRAGVPQNVAMRISGHKTDSVFRRYDIVDEDDLAEAIALTQAYVDRQRQEAPKVTPLHPAAARE